MWQGKDASGGSIFDKAKVESVDIPLRFVPNTQNVTVCSTRWAGRCK